VIFVNGHIHQGNVLLEILLILLVEISLLDTRLVVQKIAILTCKLVDLIGIDVGVGVPIISSQIYSVLINSIGVDILSGSGGLNSLGF